VNMVARTTHPHTKRSRIRFDRIRLPNPSCRTTKTTISVCGCAPSYWINIVSTNLAPWPHFAVGPSCTIHRSRCTRMHIPDISSTSGTNFYFSY
jgi:hypothetical protein